MTALVCEEVVAGYGTLAVVRKVDLSVSPGTVLTILGPNGSGKTTLLSSIAGLQPLLGGRVKLFDLVISTLPTHAVAGKGLSFVPDDRALFTNLSARENILLGATGPGIKQRVKRERVDEALERFPALAPRIEVAAGMLSGGEQQMLAIARAMAAHPRVLVIDELSMGLAPAIVESLLDKIRSIADADGTAIILVEQHAQLALEVSDRAAVMVRGELVIQVPAAELLADPDRLTTAYFGSDATTA